MTLSKKFRIKIPKSIQVLYYNKQNFLLLIGPLEKKAIKIPFKLWISSDKKYIYVTKILGQAASSNRKKALKSLCGTTVALIKQKILETSILLNKKLKFVGVGYKAFPVTFQNLNFLELKIGFSHFLYYKPSKKLKIVDSNNTTLYIFGNSQNLVGQTASEIRRYKMPEPYKGKGILYNDEKINLKEGKRV